MVKKSNRTLASLPIRIIQWIVDLGFVAAIAGFVLLFALQFPHSDRLDSVEWIRTLHHREDPIIAWPASWVGVEWPHPGGFNFVGFLPLGVGLAAWVVKMAIDAGFLAATRGLDRMAGKAPAASGGAGWTGAGESIAAADTEQAREQLLKRYREIEAALKSAKRKRCTFLAVDVVGSTKMKLGEREASIAVTFQAYEEMLRRVFDQFGAWKQAWTPDGVMVCFLQTELAMGAAKRILESMKKFNEEHNKLRTPFQLRCGLNEGEVAIFDDTKLEKVADRVIDVAGHLQKQSLPDTLWVSAEAYEMIPDKSGFKLTDYEVDGYKVYQWTIEAAVASAKQ